MVRLIDKIIQDVCGTQKKSVEGNKNCYICGAYALLYGSFKLEELKHLILIERRLNRSGVAVVPTIGYKVMCMPNDLGFCRGYMLQQKAPGEELHRFSEGEDVYNRRMTELAGQSDFFYNKFVSDWIKITESGLMIDPSKSANFFYTPEQMYFIDLNVRTGKMPLEVSFYEAAVVLTGGRKYYDFSLCRNQQQQILQKLFAAFTEHGADKGEMFELAKKYFPEISEGIFKKQQIVVSKNSQNLL